MKMIKGLFFFILALLVFISITGTWSCANIIPPTGGPRDTIPPRLVSAVPRDSVIHFTGNRIVLNFDEYVDIKNKEQNLIINPTPRTTPTIDAKLRVITIKLRDTLQANTTYSIDFGRGIVDINEGNPYKNFTYVYSTGAYLDSMSFSGRVILAATGKPDSTLIVMLYRNLDDSAVVKERPKYVARLDSTGNFAFHNLKPDTYRVYAVKDEGNSRRYNSKSQVFAFADQPVAIQQNTSPILLYAFAEEAEIKKPAKKTTTSAPPEKLTDKNKRLTLGTNIANNEFDVLDTFKIQFTTPLKTFDSTKFIFSDEQFKEITSYRVEKDSTNKKYLLYYKWVPDTKYNIVALKDFAEDTLGRKLFKNDTISFRTKRESQYGEVRLRFKNLDLARHPVLQFVQGDVLKYAYPLTSTIFTRKLFLPGEYDLRMLYDENNNGVWDPGSFFEKHRQPEKVVPITIPNSKSHKYHVRANWDNDLDLIL